MTKKTQIILIDDLDGSEAEETIQFGLDGVSYEIDLKKENSEELRNLLAKWVAAARRVGGRRNTRKSASGNPSETTKIRLWARENGHEVSDRGRIPEPVRQAYFAAN